MKKIILNCLYILLITVNIYPKFYSQYGQDEYVYNNFFKSVTNGIFVEIGADDGITFSNTYYLEKNLGWTGLCIEPRENSFKKIIKNRKCTCLKIGIAKKTGIQKFLSIEGYSQMLSGILESYDPQHLDRIKKETEKYGGKATIIDIPCFTLNSICSKHNISHINFLSIDTEGNEYDILSSINFDFLKIDVICIENNYKNTNIFKLLTSRNYILVKKFKVDEIYVKQ
jgi:FkbM family methyltransferase